MADVFQARDRLLGARVAIKVVRPEVMTSPEFRSRFEREVSISASVVHPHLVPLHDLGELADGRPYLALALADSGSLLDLRRRNPPWSLISRLMDEALSALACLHARGILHLDVKLSNVLLHQGRDGRLQAWLSDLGLAKVLGHREAFLGSLAGTLSYMPVELLLRRYAEIGPATDLFAVGVLLYRMVSATNPFKETDVTQHVRRRYRPPAFVPVRRGLRIPDGLEEIILSLLHAEARARYDLVVDLRRALQALPVVDAEEETVAVPDAREPILQLPPPLMDLRPTEPYGGPPRWNRPAPGPLPTDPMPEPGWGTQARASLALFALREVPLVGRNPERQRLWNLARDVALRQKPRVIILQGEPGVGKSRLVQSAMRELEEGGYAQAVEVSFTRGGAPGDGYVGAARRLLRLDGSDPILTRARLERWLSRDAQAVGSEIAHEARLLQHWGAPAPGDDPVSPVVAREYLFKHLLRHAWRGLSVLVVEDAHWCVQDDDGAALAASVLQLGLPVLVVLTIRSESEETTPVAASSLRALRALGAEEMVLSRISDEDMLALVEEYLPLKPDLAAAVVRKSQGNPLFARELLGQWARRGVLRPSFGRVGTEPLGVVFTGEGSLESTIPNDLRTLLGERLSLLLASSPHPEILDPSLDVVGVAGAGVPWGVLEEASGRGLDELVDGGIVRNLRGMSAMDHPLLAQILRERVQGRSFMEAHRALADAWARVATDPRSLLEVGRHELAAGRPERAIPPLMRAVDGLWIAGSVSEVRVAALELNRAAGTMLPVGEAWVKAQLALARADLGTGSRRAALNRVEFLVSMDLQGAMAVEVAAQFVDTLEYESRERLGLPALEAVEPYLEDCPSSVQARFHQALAACFLHLGRYEPAEREVRMALDASGSEALRIELLLQLGLCVGHRNVEAAIGHLESAEKRAEIAGYRSVQAIASASMARFLGVLGRWDEGQVRAEEAERLALTIGFHTHVPLCRNSRAECLRFQGRVREAENLYREGRGWAAATGQRAWVYAFDLNLALCALLQGALGAYRERLDIVLRDDDPTWEPFAPIITGLEAIWRVLVGEADEDLLLSQIDLGKILEEGLDGALIGCILVRAATGREWRLTATCIQADVMDGLARRGLRLALLEPMLRCYDEAMEL